MKFVLTFVLVAISIAVVSAGLTCFTDERKCAADECCIEVGNKVGSKWGECLKLKQLGQMCEIHQRKSLIKSHVYVNSCPCAVGMKCIDKDGKGRKVLGTCQQTY